MAGIFGSLMWVSREVSMRRCDGRGRVVAFCAALALWGSPRVARAQEPTPRSGSEPTPPGSEPTPPPGSEPTPPGGEPTPPGTEPTPPGQQPSAAAEQGEKGKLGSISWRDIVTVPRRPILKFHRVEFIPTYNVTINNS